MTEEYKQKLHQRLEEYNKKCLSLLIEKLSFFTCMPPCALYGLCIQLVGDNERNRHKYGLYTSEEWITVLQDKAEKGKLKNDVFWSYFGQHVLYGTLEY